LKEIHNPQQAIGLNVNSAGEINQFAGLTVRFLIPGSNSAGSIALFELTGAGGCRLPAPADIHDHYEETIYGLDGVMTWTVDGNSIDAGPGKAVCIPRGAVHRFDNNSNRDVKALCVITPAAIGPDYFREVAAVMEAAAGGPPDGTKIVEIMLRHGLTPAPPPPLA
jgi:quercetin dioxygenase-like cupin family protein